MKISLYRKSSIILMIVLIHVACTQKKNHVGVPDTETTPIECKISSEKLVRYYTYEDSLSNTNSTKLSVGNFHGTSAYSLFKFLHLPDSTNSIENVNLKLFIKNKEDFEDASILKIARLQTNWYESKATWFEPTDSTSWENTTFSSADFEELTNVNSLIEEDTLQISLPNELVFNWIESDSTNYGIVMYFEESEQEKFVELYSTESSSYPILTFDYFDLEQDSTIAYTSSNNLATDATIYYREGETEIISNQLRLANMFPTRMYLKFEITPEMFLEPDAEGIEFYSESGSGIESIEEFSRTNILKAELILTRKTENNDYLLQSDVRPYLVINQEVDSDSPQLPITYSDDYIAYGMTTSLSELEFHHKIDITSIIQTMFSGFYDNLGDVNSYENYGFIIKSLSDNLDLQYLDFYTETAENELYRPKIKIIYVTPVE